MKRVLVAAALAVALVTSSLRARAQEAPLEWGTAPANAEIPNDAPPDGAPPDGPPTDAPEPEGAPAETPPANATNAGGVAIRQRPAGLLPCSTKRAPSEVLLDLSTAGVPELPSKLVDVRADEWVCIGGVIAKDGELREPRLERSASEAHFSLKVTANGTKLTYEIANPGARRLVLLAFEGTMPVRRYVEPHSVGRFESIPGATRLLVTGISFHRPPPPSSRGDSARRNERKGRFELTALAGVRHLRDLSALNRELAKHGYEPLPQLIHPVGVDMNLQLENLWVSLQFRGAPGTLKHTSGEEVDSDIVDVGLDVGYSFSPVPRLNVTPYTGTHLGVVSLDVSREHPPLFAEEVSEHDSESPLQSASFVIPLGLDLSATALRWKLDAGSHAAVVVGTKVGYAFALPSSDWSDSERGIEGGPRVNLSGPFMLVSLGVGIQE